MRNVNQNYLTILHIELNDLSTDIIRKTMLILTA